MRPMSRHGFSGDPSLGRYAQPDPLGLVDGPSLLGHVSADLPNGTNVIQLHVLLGHSTVKSFRGLVRDQYWY